MASPQVKDMLNMLLQSPRGILAVILAVGSFLSLVYIFFIKSSSSGKSKPRKASGKQSSPLKSQASTASKSAKSSPASKKVSPSKATKSPASNKGKSPDKKSTDAKPADSKTARPTKTRQSDRVSGSQKSSQKDDGEWITVSKKKPRATKKAASPEQPAAPQTRSSTRRSTQASQRS